MIRRPTDLPERLLAGDATEFERRMLDAVLEKRPSAASSARMAKALGVTVTRIGTAAASKALVVDAAASKATAAAGASAAWPWVWAGILGLVIAGAIVGARAWRASRPAMAEALSSAPPVVPPASTVTPSLPAAPAPLAGERDSSPLAAAHHARLATTGGDLREEIALIDAARMELSTGLPQRALELLRHYQERYPTGSFRPEAAATQIEALLKLGHDSEARAMATRFVAEHRGSLLATRVAELVGLSASTAAP